MITMLARPCLHPFFLHPSPRRPLVKSSVRLMTEDGIQQLQMALPPGTAGNKV